MSMREEKRSSGIILEELESETLSVLRARIVPLSIVPDLGKLVEGLEFGAHVDIPLEKFKEILGKMPVHSGAIGTYGRIREQNDLDVLSYPTHTARELRMLLDGEKPLAAFFYVLGCETEEVVTFGQRFDEFVRRKMINKFTHGPVDIGYGMQGMHLLDCLPHEGWRVPAYLLLKSIAERGIWSEGMERYEGSLLGYSDKENDEYISVVYGRQK